MAEKNSKESRQGAAVRSNDQNEKRSGQQTMGERGQKLDKKDEERYRGDEEKKGEHGGNR